MNDILTLDDIKLYSGNHDDFDDGECCAVELSNLIAARRVECPPELLRCDLASLAPAEFADDHPSISRVVRSYVIGLNDAWDDERRQALKPYAAKILCTATGTEDEEARAWMATDWLVRVHTPAFLRLAGLEAEARALEGLARIADAALARAAQPTIDDARRKSAAAWAAAGAAARDAAGAAAWAAARDAAWAAAGAAARDAAWAAAGAAAWAAARDAAGEKLRPTVEELQASALVLLDAMIAVGREDSTGVSE